MCGGAAAALSGGRETRGGASERSGHSLSAASLQSAAGRERGKKEKREKKKRKKRGKGEKRVISLKLNDFYMYLLVFITLSKTLSNMYHNIDRKESSDLVVI
jgi:hypothetical protein